MNNVMLDIETLGTSKNAVIISIGAVFFDPATGQLGSELYHTIKRESCEAYGLEVDESTVKWWSEQSEEARAVLTDPYAEDLHQVLKYFDWWLWENLHDAKTVEVWGNGSSFDCGIVDNAYRRCGIKLPWRYANERDVRTIVSLGRNLLNIDPKYDFPFVGTAHNALADAKHQAAYVSHIYQALAAKVGLNPESILEIQAKAAKQAIHALFEVGNCPQSENGAGDGYIECGDALHFADKYAESILKGGAV